MNEAPPSAPPRQTDERRWRSINTFWLLGPGQASRSSPRRGATCAAAACGSCLSGALRSLRFEFFSAGRFAHRSLKFAHLNSPPFISPLIIRALTAFPTLASEQKEDDEPPSRIASERVGIQPGGPSCGPAHAPCTARRHERQRPGRWHRQGDARLVEARRGSGPGAQPATASGPVGRGAGRRCRRVQHQRRRRKCRMLHARPRGQKTAP